MLTLQEVDVLIDISIRFKLPWLKHDDAGKLILVVDNHLMSTYRTCPSLFMIQHVEGYHAKPGFSVPNDRRWFLDFGIIFHKMMQIYYREFRNPKFDVLNWAVDTAWKMWIEDNLDMYHSHPEYQTIGGIKGFSGLLLQYAHRFTPENEKLRILGTEIAFGKNREVPIFLSDILDIFLAGRMDVIVDDGFFIMPMDHKTTKSFRRDPLEYWLLDEGPTGYIYSLKTILPNYVSEEHITKRDCSRILMNIISKEVVASAPMERFKRMAIWKDETQISSYVDRMQGTCESLLRDLIRHASCKDVYRDTSHCTNMFHGKCPFYDVHRQSNKAGEYATLQNGFVKLPLWDTENVSLNGA